MRLDIVISLIILTALAVMLSLGITLGFAACRASQSHPVVTPDVVRQTADVPCRCGSRGSIDG